MEKEISGKAYTFGDNIDTDQIYPGRYLELTEKEEIAEHAMEGVDDSFTDRFEAGGILVAGSNFGCGSSREHAAITLKELGVELLLAESFARIFYRNCINLGLPLLICPKISEKVEEGNELEVNLENGKIKNLTKDEVYQGEELTDYALNILKAGGIKPLLRKEYSKN
ncbi:MAG: 3-isopropylmalate dehydratase small subunit [Thermoplasmatota archaeon]